MLFIIRRNLLHLAGRRFLRQFLFQLFQIGRSGQNAPEIFHRPVHMVLQGHIQAFPGFELGHCAFQSPDLPQQAVHFLGRLVDLPGSGQGLVQHLFIIKLTFGQLGLSRQQRPAGRRHILGQDFHGLSDDRQIFPGPCVFFRRALQGIFLPEIGGFLGGLHLYATFPPQLAQKAAAPALQRNGPQALHFYQRHQPTTLSIMNFTAFSILLSADAAI